MYCGSKEDQDKYIDTLVKENRKAAQLFPSVRKVLENFDGKVYNIRLQRAIQEETGDHIYTEERYNRVYIYIYGTAGRQYTIAALDREDMEDGKRINAKKMIESAREYRESHLKKAYQLEQQAAQIITIKEQVKQIEQLLKSVTCKLDYEIRDIYGIPSRLA